ncbi:MATE family efflux transporter [uncultured Clostridium sp.]|uniref:MATE family efflux transporter n=1 Tax=uncultured Clostridium sp. TaxID=59620 RepID=UPI0025FB6683|nr:MATE family efflux transporter [uncultured Clostridium sp.]
MNKRLDLTEGSISEKLIKLALPIMGTSFIQMAYNMIDMIWVGRDGSKAVAAVGTAGFYPWLAMAFIMISKVGGEVKVAQSVGMHDITEAKKYIKSSLELNIILAILYSAIMMAFNKPLIGLFNLGDNEVISMSRNYLIIVSAGMIFTFLNPLFTAIFNGTGNSRTPFIINTCGLLVNILLDPILIFGFHGIPAYGVSGAALATVTAQVIVTILFIITIIKHNDTLFKVSLFRHIQFKYYRSIVKIGIPLAVQNGLFTIFSMIMGILVASFGPVAIAAQKVGSQIESISWMSADGMAAALSTFVAQNYGAKKFDRISTGIKKGLITAIIWGILTTLILILFNKTIFSLFINEPEAILKGADYLKILGFSQVFMCIEITVCGIFKGFSKTFVPSAISIIFTGARVPLAYILSRPEHLGLNGIWWSISISSMFKGILLLGTFIVLYKYKKINNSDSI